MDITTFNLSNPWRTGRSWHVPVIERTITRDLENWLEDPEILILAGARQVGKTSILYQLIHHLLRSGRADPKDIYYFNLDLASISEFLEDQAGLLRFLEAEKKENIYVFIDEVQRLPQPGIFIKGLQDLRLPLKLILTGSSSLDIRTKTHEALTGRKQVFHIKSLSFPEYVKATPGLPSLPLLDQGNYHIYLDALNDALRAYAYYGGYPAVVLTDDNEKKILRLNEIFTSYLEKDIAGFMKVENLSAFRKLATLLSAQQGGLINIQELSATLGVHRETVSRYIHYLEETFVLKRLTPFFSNPRTELSKMPKLYFADAGLRNLALGAMMGGDVHMRTDMGPIMEGMVASHVMGNHYPLKNVNYWRTKSGAEVDFVISDIMPVQSIEVKTGPLRQVKISRGYRSFLKKYAPEKAILINRDLWAKTRLEDCIMETIPLSVFLMGK
ncbi:MAG: ATP-binding protein [Deltaproteobacteria bacterium]|nr:ATP-binding protein [Deltaproteobacteria bacterium]